MGRKQNQKEYRKRASKREHFHRQEPQADSGKEFQGERDNDNPRWDRFKQAQLSRLPERLPRNPGQTVVSVYVEGYEDVSFWRGIFDLYESEGLSFEINVPPREDLAKGKKVLMGMIPSSGPHRLLCVDGDFDYLFGGTTSQSQTILSAPYMFHTYVYATENYLCYAPTLHNVCVKATKNDVRIFDFEKFMAEYSRTIYPMFLWYAYSAKLESENLFTLLEFKSAARLNYLDVEDNGRATLEWLGRQVWKRCDSLSSRFRHHERDIAEFERIILGRGFSPDDTYLHMQGHTLMDNVVMPAVSAVCDELKLMNNIRISTSTKTGTALKNEQSNYNNSLREVREILLDNESYRECPLYKKLQQDIESYLASLSR